MRLDGDLAAAAVDAAHTAGFALAGFTGLSIDEEDRENLEAFLREARQGEMEWFSRHRSLRLNPQRLLVPPFEDQARSTEERPMARSALALGMIYRDREYDEWLEHSTFRIARYAVGRDYHRVLKKRAAQVVSFLQERMPGLVARICVDSVPLPEKVLARKAGLGWQGKNTNLIHPVIGSYFVLCVVLLSCEIDRELEGQAPVADHCRDCSLCVKACPTGALQEYRIDPRRCLSYITIEAKEDRLEPLDRRGWVFGCDICQEVCPYNRSRRAKSLHRAEPEFAPFPVVRHLLDGPPDPATWSLTAGMALRRIRLEDLHINYEMASRTEKT